MHKFKNFKSGARLLLFIETAVAKLNICIMLWSIQLINERAGEFLLHILFSGQ